MTTQRDNILKWIGQVSETLAEESARDAAEYSRMSPERRWQRIRAACSTALRILNESPARASHEEDVARDHERWAALMKEIEDRAGA